MTKTSQISNNPFIWINIREDIKNVGPPTKVQIAFARIDSISPII